MSAARRPIEWVWGRWSPLACWVAIAAALVDQLQKWWTIEVFRIGDKGRVALTPFLDVVYVLNQGVSYGLASGAMAPWLLTAFALLAAVAIMVWVALSCSGRLMAISLGLIVGGAIGNAVDRIHLGGVADFFSLHAFGFYWYVFNIADVAIVAGVAGLLYDSVMPNRKDVANAS
jgi:signal peptidase II